MARTCDVGRLTQDETAEHLAELWDVLDDEHREQFMQQHDLAFASEQDDHPQADEVGLLRALMALVKANVSTRVMTPDELRVFQDAQTAIQKAEGRNV